MIGYNCGWLGLGEDLRGFINVFELLNILFSVYSIGYFFDVFKDYMYVNEDYFLFFDYLIFCMNVIELSKLIYCYDGDLLLFVYCIVVSLWELFKVLEKWGEILFYF